MKFQINVTTIKALELFAGKADVRWYLNGIFAEAIDPFHVRLIATNGHVLAEHRINLHKEEEFSGPFPSSGIIPRDAFKGLKGLINVELTPGAYSLDEGARTGKLIDGKFPETDPVWPRNANGRVTHINPMYVGLLDDAAKLLDVRNSGHIFQNGTDTPAVFKIREDFAGILMPQRMAKHETMPEWCVTKVDSDALLEAAPALLAVVIQWSKFMRDNYKPQDISFWDETEEARIAAGGVDLVAVAKSFDTEVAA